MGNNYPTQQKNNNRRYPQQCRSPVPMVRPNNNFIPTTIIPSKPVNGRNVAGLIKTRVHLVDAHGNQMDITQCQEVLNLMNSARGSWFVNSGGNNHTNKNKRR